MKVSLLVSTYNRPDSLNLVIKSVLSQSHLPDEVVIADDGSSDDTRKLIEKFSHNSTVKFVHSWQEDKGFRLARSRNLALAKISSEYVILIDGDMILHSSFIYDHLRNAKKGFFLQGKRVLLSETLTNEVLLKKELKIKFFSKGIKNKKNQIKSNILCRIFSRSSKKLRGIKTCNMSFFLDDCLKVNGFNNDIEGWGREDSEFAARLLNSGVTRKDLMFNAIQFHLWHHESSKASMPINDLILKNTIDKKLTTCENGISDFL